MRALAAEVILSAIILTAQEMGRGEGKWKPWKKAGLSAFRNKSLVALVFGSDT